MERSFPICFEFIVANEEAASGLSEHAGPEGSLDISITFRRGYRGTLQVRPFTVKHVQMSRVRRHKEGNADPFQADRTCGLDSQIPGSYLFI